MMQKTHYPVIVYLFIWIGYCCLPLVVMGQDIFQLDLSPVPFTDDRDEDNPVNLQVNAPALTSTQMTGNCAAAMGPFGDQGTMVVPSLADAAEWQIRLWLPSGHNLMASGASGAEIQLKFGSETCEGGIQDTINASSISLTDPPEGITSSASSENEITLTACLLVVELFLDIDPNGCTAWAGDDDEVLFMWTINQPFREGNNLEYHFNPCDSFLDFEVATKYRQNCPLGRRRSLQTCPVCPKSNIVPTDTPTAPPTPASVAPLNIVPTDTPTAPPTPASAAPFHGSGLLLVLVATAFIAA